MNLPIAPLAAAILGGLAALGVVVLPGDALESLVMDSGLPAVLDAAAPPLGFTARAAIALGVGGFVALFSWLALFILVGTRGLTVGDVAEKPTDDVATPILRRADAHPDAPPRPPLLATRDLGTPFLDVRVARADLPEIDQEVREASLLFGGPRSAPPLELELPSAPPMEQDLPMDLDQPLAAFDPAAILDLPLPPPIALPPLRPAPRPPVFDDRERFEVFELTPPVRRAPAPAPVPAPRRQADAIANPRTEASVHALLERLERGVTSGGFDTPRAPAPRPRDAERGLEEALVTLRNLARRA